MSRSFTITVHLEELPVEIQIEAESMSDWYVNDVTSYGNQLPWEAMLFRDPKGLLLTFEDKFRAEIESGVRDGWIYYGTKDFNHAQVSA